MVGVGRQVPLHPLRGQTLPQVELRVQHEVTEVILTGLPEGAMQSGVGVASPSPQRQQQQTVHRT